MFVIMNESEAIENDLTYEIYRSGSPLLYKKEENRVIVKEGESLSFDHYYVDGEENPMTGFSCPPSYKGLALQKAGKFVLDKHGFPFLDQSQSQ